MTDNVFVIMPAYNAALTIERVFARLPDQVRRRVKRYVVVNDGSRDATQDAIERLKKDWPTLVGLRHEVNRGYGEAEKTLLDYAVGEGADIAVLLHSDGQYSPESIPDLLAPFDRDEADIVMGSRMLSGGALKGNMPLYKYVGNKALTAVENWALQLDMAEYHSGFMVYNRRAMTTIPYHRLSGSFDFDLEMIVLGKVKNLRIREVGIPTIYADEKSHLNPVKYGLDVLKVVWDYKRGYYHALASGAGENTPYVGRNATGNKA
jgi:glycosyltransferase involved in cell wall biosynthesis